MKSILFIVFAGVFVFTTYPGYAQCPIPVGDTGFGLGPRIPGNYDMMDNLSPNGKILSYLDQDGDNGAHLLDLASLADTLIQVNGGLPGEQDISWTGITWCPYDSDLVALNVISFIDTTNMGVSTVYVENIFTYRISTGESQIIRPSTDYIYGSTGIYSWLPGSKQGMDSLVIGFGFGSGNPGFYGIYVPQTQVLIPLTYNNSPPETLALSRNLEDTIYRYDVKFSLNSQHIIFPRGIDTLDPGIQATFSPDSKLFALEATPYEVQGTDTVFDQVWIYNVSDPTKAIDVINFQQLYCKYSLDGIWPEFITDSTLAVSMYTDGDTFSPLWEIGIDGHIIRQLTFFPKFPSSVANAFVPANSIQLSSYPNPLTQSTKISFTLPESEAAEVTIVNLLGSEVARLFSGSLSAGEHSFEWDAGQAAAGTYFCALRIINGVQRVALVVDK